MWSRLSRSTCISKVAPCCLIMDVKLLRRPELLFDTIWINPATKSTARLCIWWPCSISFFSWLASWTQKEPSSKNETIYSLISTPSIEWWRPETGCEICSINWSREITLRRSGFLVLLKVSTGQTWRHDLEVPIPCQLQLTSASVNLWYASKNSVSARASYINIKQSPHLAHR